MQTRYIITLFVLTLLLSGCGEFPTVQRQGQPQEYPAAGPPPSAGSAQAQVVSLAASLVGTPYKFGGNSPRGFDCSGFTSYVFNQAGITLPRTASAQYAHSRRVRRAELAVGDLLFFRIGGSISHVAIYIGEDKFIHAPSSGKQVSFDNLSNPYWQEHWIGNGRVF